MSEWKDNRQWEGAEYDKNGNIIATYSEGCRETRQLTVDIFDKAKQLAVLVECLQ
ncbi:MAG: hypothetical protein OSA08_14765 [Arenicellales bacterium]|nr:hypothetical protein [Arenicellales bacterium]